MLQVMKMMSIWTKCHMRYLRRNHILHFMFLLPFHSTILKPDFDLPFTQTQCMCYFDPSSTSQIPIKVKLLLQFQRLVSSVWCPLSFGFSKWIHSIWMGKGRAREGGTERCKTWVTAWMSGGRQEKEGREPAQNGVERRVSESEREGKRGRENGARNRHLISKLR